MMAVIRWILILKDWPLEVKFDDTIILVVDMCLNSYIDIQFCSRDAQEKTG